jgi:hypothetical protein
MMDSHQVEGQRRCTFERSMRLPRVKTPDGPQQHGRAERRQDPTSKGSFLAPLRTHSRGQQRLYVPVLKAAVRRRYRGCLAFGTIPADSNPAQTATDPETCLHKQKTGDHAQHQIDDGARLLGRVGQHLVGRPDK